MIKIMTFTMAILLVLATCVFAQVDTDNDGILDDGDFSGIAGDNPCANMQTQNCDDNCPLNHNPQQEDFDNDGVGEACCCVLPGDINGDGSVNILDIIQLMPAIFEPHSVCFNTADTNGNGVINILDITQLIAFLYKGGPAPVCGTTY